jgi:hypothetical protein
LWPCQFCAELQHQLGLAKLYRSVRSERVARLEKEMFAGSNASSAPKATRPTVRKSAKSDNFGSLAAAFGQPEKSERAVPQSKPATKKASSSLQFLNPGERWMLDHLGAEPDRNRADFFRRITQSFFDEPLTQDDWQKQLAIADESLFEVASEECGRLGKLLAVAETLGSLLNNQEAGYEESIADAHEHFSRLTAPGWILSGPLTWRLIQFQGLETRLTRMFGSPPAKDLEKLDRYHDRAAHIWNEDSTCECGECPDAIRNEALYEKDFDLRLQVFAPEIMARLK